jgi:hypothetical protein
MHGLGGIARLISHAKSIFSFFSLGSSKVRLKECFLEPDATYFPLSL